jgi:hypothetical protein
MRVRAVPRKKIRVSIKTSALFKSLVENGFDFLKKSVADIKKSPKYSVINFCSAVEIFLKARLIREHWSLILAKPEFADVIKFKGGDFVSVSMEEAIRRLNNICSEKLSHEAEDAFRAAVITETSSCISFIQVTRRRQKRVYNQLLRRCAEVGSIFISCSEKNGRTILRLIKSRSKS